MPRFLLIVGVTVSLKALVWVMEEAPTTDPTSLLILYALADRADSHGRDAWPTQDWVAKRARCSSRTVRRKLSELETAGVISRGNPKAVEHIQADRRPTVWNLNFTTLDTTGQIVHPLDDNDRTNSTERPDKNGITTGQKRHNGRTQLCPTNRPKPSLTVHKPSNCDFDVFWKLYPRKTNKNLARNSYEKQLRETTPETLLQSVKNFADEMQGVEKKWIPHCSTWLNQERWRDYLVETKSSVLETAEVPF